MKTIPTNDTLMLGVSRRDITPEIGALLMGYNPHTVSNKINDKLNTTAFVFKYGTTKVALVSITVCLISDTICNELRQKISEITDIPFENIMLSATHTHSGPITTDMVGWGEPDLKYLEENFYPNVINSVKEANEKLTFVEMGYSIGNSYVGINRRELNDKNEIAFGQCEWGAFNPKMTVISFKDCDQNIIANIIHYGCHATAAGNNLEISRDWPGVMTDILERESGAITAFFNGPEGDVGPRLSNGHTVGQKNIQHAMDLGAVAGYDAVRIFKQINHYYNPVLTVSSRLLELKLSPRVSYEYAKEQYELFKNETINIRAQSRDYYEKIIKSYENGYKEKEYTYIPQTAFKLGDIAFAGFPYELFSEIGMRINKMSSIGHVMSIACTNGTLSYFPTEEQLCRGGYEVFCFQTANLQPLAPGFDFNLITETLKTLENL